MIRAGGDWGLGFLCVHALDPDAIVAHELPAFAPGKRMGPDDRMTDRRIAVDPRRGVARPACGH